MLMHGWMPDVRRMLMHVRMGMTNLAVAVHMRMEVPAAPAQEQANGQKHGDRPVASRTASLASIFVRSGAALICARLESVNILGTRAVDSPEPRPADRFR